MWWPELWERYLQWLPSFQWVVLAGAGAAAVMVWKRELFSVRVRWAAVAAAFLLGLREVQARLSLVDDAFISLRYANNLMKGDGFVFNPGEAVLGITNAGWTLMLAGLSLVTRISLPHAALFSALTAYVLLVYGTARVSDALAGDERRPPLAAMGVALSWMVCSFASTGLESLAVVALVVLGLNAIVRERWQVAGLFLVLAATFRLDQGLFLGVGALVALRHSGLKEYLRATPILGLLLLWSWAQYGSPLPNTAAAKASGAYFEHGGFYIYAFLITSHLIWLLPLSLVGFTRAESSVETRFRDFVLPAGLIWLTYVGYVGGDFMIGRFLLVMIPLILLSAERGLHLLPGGTRVVAGAVIGATVYGLPVLEERKIEWWMADEGSIYPVASVFPFEVDHHTFKLGQFLNEVLVQRGWEPTIAAHGVGMVGFYSELPIIDILGLTDTVTANAPLEKRGRPGHERNASREHLLASGAVLSSLPPFPRQADLTDIRVRPEHGFIGHWHMLRYEPAVIERLRTTIPELEFFDLEAWLDQFVRDIAHKETGVISSRLTVLDSFYFNQPGADMSYRKAMVDAVEERRLRAELEAIGYASGQNPAEGAGGLVLMTDAAQPGLNLVTSASGPEALLLGMSGEVVHRWTMPFAKAFPGKKAPNERNALYFRRVHAFDNGDLLAIFEGAGIVRMNKDSEVLWARLNRAHHDIEIDSRGHIWTLTRAFKQPTPYNRALVEDFVVELGADGEELRRHSVLDAVLKSEFRPQLDAFMTEPQGDAYRQSERQQGDALHTNTLAILPRTVGPLKKGHLMLSSRTLSLLFTMDPATGQVVWGTRGEFDGQHDPWLMPDDSLLLFDNGLRKSRVLRIDAAGNTLWQWSRPGFFTRFCGTVQPLGDGHVLVTESLTGRALEIDAEGTVVWEWLNPKQAANDPLLTANLFEVRRFPLDYGEGWLSD